MLKKQLILGDILGFSRLNSEKVITLKGNYDIAIIKITNTVTFILCILQSLLLIYNICKGIIIILILKIRKEKVRDLIYLLRLCIIHTFDTDERIC